MGQELRPKLGPPDLCKGVDISQGIRAEDASVHLFPRPRHDVLCKTVKKPEFVRGCFVTSEVVFHGGNVVGEWVHFPIVAHVNKKPSKNKIRVLTGW